MEYRTDKEARYLASDYNKYIKEKCRRNMTVINIDVLQWDYRKNILRIVESKHLNEHIGYWQLRALKLLAIVFGYCNSVAKRITFQIYIVRGNPPYKKIFVENLITGTKTTLYNDDVKKFSELDLSL